MLNLFRVLFINALLFIGTSYAAAANSVMTIELPITSKEQPVTTLLSQGLTIVLTRLTGDPNIAEQKVLAEMISKPNDYIENYSQQSNPDRLVMSFDQQSIENTLNKLQVSYWDNRRPLIMTWWLSESDDGTNLIGDGQSATKVISSAADTQGFPVRFPLADLNEQAIATKENFTENPPKELLTAAKQYMPNTILIVYMQQKNGNYQANWQLWLNNDNTKPLAQAQIKGSSVQQLSEQIFTTINPELAKVFIVKDSGTSETLDIIIKGLSFARYVEVNNLLSGFDGKVIETTGSTVHYQVKANPAQITAQLNLLHFSQAKANNDNQARTDKITTLIFQPTDQ